jgi:proteasome lid subunit RPN8/RPN11
MLKLSGDLTERIRAHAAQSYPYECCGALLGAEQEDGRVVRDLVMLDNQRDDSPRNRFLVRPEDVLRVEKAARERGLDLLGWYHSHPDAPARPSEFDREHAWPWYSYVIVSVEAGEPRRMTSWRLTDDRVRFDDEAIASGLGMPG